MTEAWFLRFKQPSGEHLYYMGYPGRTKEHPSGGAPPQFSANPEEAFPLPTKQACEHLKGGVAAFKDGEVISRADALRGYVKCDGNHAGPRCADPECWWDDEPQETFR